MELDKLRKQNLISRKLPAMLNINGGPAGLGFKGTVLPVHVNTIERLSEETFNKANRTIDGWTAIVSIPSYVNSTATMLGYASGVTFTLKTYNLTMSSLPNIVSSHMKSINLDRMSHALFRVQDSDSVQYIDCFRGCILKKAVIGIHTSFLNSRIEDTHAAFLTAKTTRINGNFNTTKTSDISKSTGVLCVVQIPGMDALTDMKLAQAKAFFSNAIRVLSAGNGLTASSLAECNYVATASVESALEVVEDIPPSSILAYFSSSMNDFKSLQALQVLCGLLAVVCVNLDEHYDVESSKPVSMSNQLQGSRASTYEKIEENNRSTLTDKKFFIFMPWEQLNNQLIALRCACAAAKVLGRTLVLPPIGFRQQTQTSSEWDFTFNITDFHWEPFGTYFDESVARSQLPCQTASLFEFVAWSKSQPNFTLENVYFNPVARATDTGQLHDYYSGVLGIPIESINSTGGKLAQLTKHQLHASFGTVKSSVLAIGAAFWLYGFGKTQPYPLREYFDYMEHPVYRQTVEGLRVKPELSQAVNLALHNFFRSHQASWITKRRRKLYALHVRRGDYWNKCRRIDDEMLQKKCYPRTKEIISALSKAVGWWDTLRVAIFGAKARPLVYIATNDVQDVRRELESFQDRFQFVFFASVFNNATFASSSLGDSMNPILSALLDMELCSQADSFVGNIYSSFSRSIVERRQLGGRSFSFF
ncbi:hypothetical protein HDU96_010534 [Phlyctochytrium bullatum]|nr:hypothetical protein HDU96_010534 [Phlyctochytrium bullatum]